MLYAWLDQQHEDLLAVVNRMYEENRRAIDALWQQCGSPGSAQSATAILRKQHGNLIEAVRHSARRIPGSFTLQDVETRLRAEQPLLMAQSSRKSISTALRRLYEARELALIQEGRGTKPARYAVVPVSLGDPDGKEVPMDHVSGRPA